MPYYSYKCRTCGTERGDMRKIDERHDGPQCDRGHGKMELQIDPVSGSVKNPAVPRGRR